MAIAPIQIAGRAIGPGCKPYVIAEVSANHAGNLDRALALIDAAAAAGADAVKLQTYTADTLTLDADQPEFRIQGGLWHGRSFHELYQEAHTPWDWHPALFARAKSHGLTIFSTPFDPTALALLESLEAPAYKVASFELVDLPLIRQVAATGKPMILSTGLANLDEIGEAVQAAREGGCREMVLLHCISGYPTPIADANLATIPDLAARFGVPVGLSDHTMGITAATVAVALGASVIEKHFTLRRADGGPDAAFSLEPEELGQLVQGCADAFAAIGTAGYEVKDSERGNLGFRRSLYAVADIAAGEVLTDANIRSIRPGLGLAPKHLDQLLGQRAAVAIKRGTALRWDLLDRSA